MQTVTVLICTYNRHKLLQSALDALICRTIEKPDQIVIVNGGDEQADRVAQEFSEKYSVPIKLIKTKNVNLATSRNVGLPHCTEDIVAMTDDDAEVFPEWITKIRELHAAHPEAGGIGGAIIGADSGGSFVSRLSDVVTFPQPAEPTYIRTIPGVNASYKRNILVQIGEQDTILMRGEDVDYNWRIKKLGYEILFHPDMKVLHHHRPTIKQFFRQHYMYGRGYYLVRRKWKEMYCLYPHHLIRVKDWLKLVNFFVSLFYQSFFSALRVKPWYEFPLAFPAMLINGVCWRTGMIYQMFLEINPATRTTQKRA
jgi:GT2 family glycosyltransferase